MSSGFVGSSDPDSANAATKNSVKVATQTRPYVPLAEDIPSDKSVTYVNMPKKGIYVSYRLDARNDSE